MAKENKPRAGNVLKSVAAAVVVFNHFPSLQHYSLKLVGALDI